MHENIDSVNTSIKLISKLTNGEKHVELSKKTRNDGFSRKDSFKICQ